MCMYIQHRHTPTSPHPTHPTLTPHRSHPPTPNPHTPPSPLVAWFSETSPTPRQWDSCTPCVVPTKEVYKALYRVPYILVQCCTYMYSAVPTCTVLYTHVQSVTFGCHIEVCNPFTRAHTPRQSFHCTSNWTWCFY